MADVNLNRNFVKDSMCLILDAESRGILATCQSGPVANRLQLAYPNLGVARLPSQVPAIAKRYEAFDFNDTSVYYNVNSLLSGPDNVKTLADHQITEDLITIRNDVRMRIQWMLTLEAICLNETGPVHNYNGMQWLLPWLTEELGKCDPEKGNYSSSFEEMAEFNGISVETYYQELKMEADSIGMAMLRNHSIWMKYSMLMARAPANVDDLKAVLDAARDHLYKNSWI